MQKLMWEPYTTTFNFLYFRRQCRQVFRTTLPYNSPCFIQNDRYFWEYGWNWWFSYLTSYRTESHFLQNNRTLTKTTTFLSYDVHCQLVILTVYLVVSQLASYVIKDRKKYSQTSDDKFGKFRILPVSTIDITVWNNKDGN